MRQLNGLSTIAGDYDAFLLDLWGVIHDGSALYPGAHETLEQLKAANKCVIFLSNAPRRAARVQNVLTALGVNETLYETVVSSGEVGFLALSKLSPLTERSYYFIGPQRDADVLDGLPFHAITRLQDAAFLLNVGFGSEEQDGDAWDDLLAEAARFNLPMVCLNPDKEVVKITGERYPCAGVIAHAYAALGGEVQWFGKPYLAVYAHCLKLLANVTQSRILAVGDGLETDILGANRAGIDSALVSGGILRGRTQPEINALCRELGSCPDYVLPSFTW